ncbi:MAG: Mth938-like domain-containing protein [Thioalkalivibrionaceae bacterium]
MLVNELKDISRPLVTSIGDDAIHVSGRCFTVSLLLHDDQVQTQDVPARFGDLTASHILGLWTDEDARPEIVIIGCGPRSHLPSRELRVALRDAGLSCEFMPTHAAARTYNLIVAEGRRVSAFLLLGD